MTETKGHGSHAAKRANAAASHEGKTNPRTSSKAQSILGKKGCGGEEALSRLAQKRWRQTIS